MNMTHYMGLLADHQPWNLILFMAIPVILAETVAITELQILFTRNFRGTARKVNKIAGILAGTYFAGVFVYLTVTVAIPLTVAWEWRGAADVIAVGAYLLGVVPLVGIALHDLGIIGNGRDDLENFKSHTVLVAIFLVITHVAMIFGMLDPSVLGHSPTMTAPADSPMSNMHSVH